MPDDTQARPCCVTHAVEMARARMDAIQMHRDLWLTTGVQTQAREAHAAAWHVRRLANRHDCAGLCGAPEHAADTEALREVLEVLGLAGGDEQPRPPKASPIEHGTRRGYEAHHRRKEEPCQECKDARSEYDRSRRRARGLRTRVAQCGTSGGWWAHYRRGEDPCDACRAAYRDYRRERRRAQDILPKRPPRCGTYSGYQSHRRRGEEACEECRAAKRDYRRDRTPRPASGMRAYSASEIAQMPQADFDRLLAAIQGAAA